VIRLLTERTPGGLGLALMRQSGRLASAPGGLYLKYSSRLSAFVTN
jgi:hypothetical protein